MVHPKAQMLLLLFAMGHLVGLSQKHYEIPPPRQSRNHIFYIVLYSRCFTQYRTYLHGFTLIRPMFYIYTYMNVDGHCTFTWSVNKFHCRIYTYT